MTSKSPRLTPEGGPRYFSSCDAARIARNVVSDRGEPPEVVLACIAKGLGYRVIAIPTEGITVNSFAGSANLALVRLVLRLIAATLRRVPGLANQLDTATAALEELETKIQTFLSRDFQVANVDDVLIRSKFGCNCKDQPSIPTKRRR